MSSKKEQSPSMTAAKYADILHLARPKPSHLHPRMLVENRAKIFSPFQEDTVHPASPPLGIFCELTGRVERIDPVFQTLHLSDGTVRTDIRFEDLDDIDIL